MDSRKFVERALEIDRAMTLLLLGREQQCVFALFLLLRNRLE